MARRRRLPAGGVTHHVIQRGNDRKPMFFSDDDRLLYPNWLSAAMARHGALLHAYVLMTNHVHLLLTTECALTLPRILQSLGRRYVAHVNATYRRRSTPHGHTLARPLPLDGSRQRQIPSRDRSRHRPWRQTAAARAAAEGTTRGKTQMPKLL